jgi:hypothetical protein
MDAFTVQDLINRAAIIDPEFSGHGSEFATKGRGIKCICVYARVYAIEEA